MPTPPVRPDEGAARADLIPLRKWYFCANTEAMRGRTFKLLRAAIHSCLRHTTLQPVCLYYGERAPALKVMRDMGVTVIRHRPSLEPLLRPAYGTAYETFAGHWLRLDIPRLETEDTFVLYTDIDVLFRGLPDVLDGPELLSVAPERWRTEWHPFNSGVLLMNVPGLRGIDAEFRAQITERLTGNFTYPTHDQASFNQFFEGRAGALPLEMNWKPYWGVNQRAQIIHYHGPKPSLVDHIARRGMDAVAPGHRFLYRLAPAAHRAYADLYAAELAAGPPDPAARPKRPTMIRQPGPRPPLGFAARLRSAGQHARNTLADQARTQVAHLRGRLGR
ncbi:hypothetical protein JANAI62_23570 [Jannaschia pagri]|uniref:Nucleotide-diphospho-sugar transferase n=1 Tax=Jannaschia pagri TaxID=2829797 RepID=A0ABQ4NMX3_9RHOB|nr:MULTISPECIES: hypothetical protein [unclassified Jannaschia]GIT91900.1 hypothetical protein JANAI61_23580 [Jannaschia sp. AI_61]GIT95734.1 hypothetical protein JANAI62_23570 [Jannaschia sp. AI_62]